MDDRIYKYQRRLEVAEKNLQEARMLEYNRKSIEDYVRFRRVNGLSIQRQCKYIYTMKLLGKLAGQKNFKDLTREDMINILDQVKSRRKDNGDPKYKLSTLRDFMILWRTFIAWVHGVEDPRHEGYPKAVSWFRPKEPKNELKPSDLITPNEEERLLAACCNLRDRAIIGVQSECGLRPGELLGLKVKDVKIESSCLELSLDGKTGVRPAYCIRSMPHLLAWLDVHPCRNDPQAYLWGLKGQAYTYSAFRQMLRKVTRRAKIQKPIWPYLMRHSSVTDSADSGLTESQLDAAYGWVQGSKSPKTYIHLSGRNVKKAMLQKAGLVPPHQVTRTVKLCPRCNKPVATGASLCPSCGSVVSVKAALTIQQDRDELKKDVESLKESVDDLKRTLMKTRYHHMTDEEVNEIIAAEKKAHKILGKLVVEK